MIYTNPQPAREWLLDRFERLYEEIQYADVRPPMGVTIRPLFQDLPDNDYDPLDRDECYCVMCSNPNWFSPQQVYSVGHMTPFQEQLWLTGGTLSKNNPK